MVVDQPIQKISFCSPDQQNDRIFSYIARDGSTRRWICYVFVAFKGTTVSGGNEQQVLVCIRYLSALTLYRENVLVMPWAVHLQHA